MSQRNDSWYLSANSPQQQQHQPAQASSLATRAVDVRAAAGREWHCGSRDVQVRLHAIVPRTSNCRRSTTGFEVKLTSLEFQCLRRDLQPKTKPKMLKKFRLTKTKMTETSKIVIFGAENKNEIRSVSKLDSRETRITIDLNETISKR